MELDKIISGAKIASKSDAANDTRLIRKAISEGLTSALPYFVAASYADEVFKSIIKDDEIRQIAISEVEKYGKGGFSFNGAKVETTTRAEYDYSNTPMWCELESQIQALKAVQKSIEKAAQGIPDGIAATVIITEDGEEIQVNKPLRKASTIIKTTLPK